MNKLTAKSAHAKKQRLVLVIALVLVACLAIGNSLMTPLFEPPDELQHYEFVRYLVNHQALPIQALAGEPSQSHQPPLYYVIGALIVSGIDDSHTIPPRNPFWSYYQAGKVSQDNKLQYLNPPQPFPYSGTTLVVHLLRFWSVLLALGTVTATWSLGITLWPDSLLKVTTMLALSVLNPMFLYIAGSANNDNLVILCGALVTWISIKGVKEGFSWSKTILIGLIWACAILTKITGLFLAVPWGVALTWVVWQRRDIKYALPRTFTITALAMVISAWWFARNLRIYNELLALQRNLDVWGTRQQVDLIWLWQDLVYSWTTTWGRFAYGQVPLPRLFYWVFLIILILAVFPIAQYGIKLGKQRSKISVQAPQWVILFLTTAIYVAGLGYYIVRSPTGANGRYVFPALPALAALITWGLSSWSQKWKDVALKSTILLMIIISVFAIGVFLPWVYARPQLITYNEALNRIENPNQILWGDSIELVGTTVTPRQVSQGDIIELTACWVTRAEMDTNYTLYIHVLDNKFSSLGQRDTFPGLGTFPTSFWKTGDVFCDTYPTPITSDVTLPLAAEIEIGFYELENDQAPEIKTTDGHPLDRVVVDQIKVSPKSPPTFPPPQYQTNQGFDQGVSLVGYSWTTDQAAPTDTVEVTLYWNAAGPLDESYTIFAHLLDVDGQMVTQADGLPRDGAYPTNFWDNGEIIIDTRMFRLPTNIKAGPSSLRLGFYRNRDSWRLPREPEADLLDFVELAGPEILSP